VCDLRLFFRVYVLDRGTWQYWYTFGIEFSSRPRKKSSCYVTTFLMRLGEWFASPTRVYMGGDNTPLPIHVASSRTATGSKEWCCDQRSIECSMEKFWFGWLCYDTSVSRLSLLVYSFAVRSCNCQWIAWLSVAMHACSCSLDSSCVSSRSKQLQVSGATRELKPSL